MARQRMVTGGGNKVIHRKARASREEYHARAMSPAKALRLALAQASDTHFDLPMIVTTVEQVEISQTALRAEFNDGGLLVLLDGPKGARGAVRLDDALLSALIEVQTTGRVSGRPPGGRAVTRTDAAIAAPLIDATLERAEAQLSEEAPDHWASGFRFGVMMEDARGMSLALNAAAFHVFRMTVELGEGALPGSVAFLLPVPVAPPPPATAPGVDKVQRTLEQSAMNAPVSMEAVLGRVSLPLTQLCGLAPGDVVPFQMDRPLQIRLETGQKHVVALGRLGQMNGMRAVRLTPGDDSANAANMAALNTAPPPDEHKGTGESAEVCGK
ncbi:FliM/FliN family flagellar motor C-terminal domain-containing protein [Roseovarius sp. M141]|uniref:FliM/FliN family flagellar motor C-terminal domain-containing protein n=1 Tax=Roseovarius sp. M141 TaxID=2583806 RepID=UPI0020CF93BA|nr:FliM/FliN family flagellar motor C-terminal domain-containing protein [Roseovarius sp. M141]MCQ0093851.1 FliM/FliN family flagellar motor switch protein [Roseovarius sp. M141]